MQYVSRYYRVPQISFGSISNEFTENHDTKYPYFLRTTANQKNITNALISYIQNQGWKHIAVIYTTDSTTFYSAKQLVDTAEKFNVKVLVSVSFASGARNLTKEMQILKKSRARIIVAICISTDVQTIMKNSLRTELHGIGYQWLGLQAHMYPALYMNASGMIDPDYYQWTQGFIGLQPRPDLSSPLYQAYRQRWASTPTDNDTWKVAPDEMFSVADMAYDAVYMFAHALHNMIEINQSNPMDQKHRELFLETLKRVNFTGVTGQVFVDHNGDRMIGFAIVNFQNGSVVPVGHVDLTGRVTYSENISTLYGGGTHEKPQDLPAQPLLSIPKSIGYIMFAFTISLFAFCWLTIGTLIWYRNESIIRASSFIFLLLMLIGIVFISSCMMFRILENILLTKWMCISEFVSMNIGYSLVMTTLMVG